MKKDEIFITKGYDSTRDQIDDIFYYAGKNLYCMPHFHKQIEMLYAIKGSVFAKINGKELTINEGDFIITNSYDIHEFIQISEASCCIICLPNKYLHYYENIVNNNKFNKNLLANSDNTRKIYELMCNLSNHNTQDELTNSGYILILLGLIVKNIGLEEKAKIYNSKLSDKIFKYIDQNYKEDLSLDNISDYCGYNKFYISRVFNASSDCNINEYINLRRLQAFLELKLTNNEDTINNAMAVGFNCTRTFYKVFKEHYKMTPKEYFKIYKD